MPKLHCLEGVQLTNEWVGKPTAIEFDCLNGLSSLVFKAENRASFSTLCSLGLSANHPAVLFSHTKSAPATSQSALLFSHNKSAPAISHSQAS